MSLIVVCGQPSSGKSGICEKLGEAFRALGLNVVHVDEPGLHLHRNDAYKDALSEKRTRGQLKSAVERAITKNNVVLLDSLNNIKGYRYELWCVARSTRCKYCMVHVETPIETCREWNLRRAGDTYSPEVFNDLVGRFERPDPRQRWDAPLFTVRPDMDPAAGAPVEGDSEAATTEPDISGEQTSSACRGDAGADLQLDFLLPPDQPLDLSPEGPQSEAEVLEAIVRAMTEVSAARGKHAKGQVAAGGSGVAAAAGVVRGGPGVQTLQPTFATNSTPLTLTNTLHEIDQAAQDIVTAMNDAQTAAAGGAPGVVRFGEGLQALQLNQPVTLAELRRHKRAFLKLATKIMFARLQDSASAKRMFIEYLKDNLTGAGAAHGWLQ